MRLFETAEDIVDAIIDCKDPKETRRTLIVLTKFAMHERDIIKDKGVHEGLTGDVLISILMLSLKNASKSEEKEEK